MAKVFVSYSRTDGDWVWTRLKPVLEAGCGNEKVLIDEERVRTGGDVYQEIALAQEAAVVHVLVLTEHAFTSTWCRLEHARAIAADPDCQDRAVVSIRRDDTPWSIETAPLAPELGRRKWLDLRPGRDELSGAWDRLLEACHADLRAPAPAWLAARDDLAAALGQQRPVNLVIAGHANARPLIEHLKRCRIPRAIAPDLGIVDLYDPATATRPALLSKILSSWNGLGDGVILPDKPKDLVAFAPMARERPRQLALLHFDHIGERLVEYERELFATLHHATDLGWLTPLFVTRRSFASIVSDLAPTIWPTAKHMAIVRLEGSE